ncbi:hypothetical protein [Methylomonas rosea]|uniref:HD-GYP domain-containing protein n=1 Tax=Methylomonas rosea TaxID=2952227 RepID=A0ABT1TWN4_9GAMM|nr:hypothetical protein [Methylomonas sp. WSC-7]MCQ8118771.1 hypothetical protein [Methylomonas sp. WSC-7]
MQDSGKVGISGRIQRKWGIDSCGVVNHEVHPQIGFDILCKNPAGLVGTAIPKRIAALVDVFDAITMKRLYKDAWSIESAVSNTGTLREMTSIPY